MSASIFPDLIPGALDSPDKRQRRGDSWVGIVVHHTGIPEKAPQEPSAWAKFAANMAAWLTANDDVYLSAHFLIAPDGMITQIVNPDSHESFHAGRSQYWHPLKRAVVDDWNRHAIGIELVGDGNRIAYPVAQYKALGALCRRLMQRYPTIHPQAIVGHEQIAPGRKTDPGMMFDWPQLFRLIYTT